MRTLRRAVKACLAPLFPWLGLARRARSPLGDPGPPIELARDVEAGFAVHGGQEYLPFCCARPFRDEDLGDDARQAARWLLGIAPGRLALVTLGNAGVLTGAFECLWALEQLRTWQVPADLCFVGPGNAAMQQRLREEALRLHVGELVFFRNVGICDDTHLCYLLAADFAIQLRRHNQGQPSQTLLDCISAGLPTVCNEELAETMDSPNYVLRIPDHISPLLIAEQIADAHAAGRHHQRCTAARRTFVLAHGFERRAEELRKVLRVA
jgi:hypothetical protein